MKKVILLSILMIFSASFIVAQVNLEINSGMLVETTGGLSIELSGDLIENGTGYLKGVVTSGDRGADALSSFAGLTITTGGVDQITRTTGTPLSSSIPKTSLRKYDIENTTALTSNISSVYLESGVNDETNGIGDAFLYKKVGTAWTGYSDNSTAVNTIGAASFNIPASSSEIVIAEGLGVAAKIYLEGPYTSLAMSTSLTGLIPLVSPYSEDPRTASAIPTGAVDWVLVELRNPTNTVLSSRAAFVNSSGQIIDDNGVAEIGLPAPAGTVTPGSYYLAVKHRNHLAIMSAAAQSITWATP